MIKYKLEKPGRVTIAIYNQLGKCVEVIKENQSQGVQEVRWTPGNLPSGLYYVKLQAGGIVASGKVLLIR